MHHEKFIQPKFNHTHQQVFDICKTPCKKMTIQLSLISQTEVPLDHTFLKFEFKQTARVEKKIIVYSKNEIVRIV